MEMNFTMDGLRGPAPAAVCSYDLAARPLNAHTLSRARENGIRRNYLFR